MRDAILHFDVKSGLKRVLGRDLITNDEVALFELVKNSFDASASAVLIYFDDDHIIVADDGSGMTYLDVLEKWLRVAYSAKRHADGDYRDIAASRIYLAGNKGIGRFSTDRLGSLVTLQTRHQSETTASVHRIEIDWDRFERDELERFESVPVIYSEQDAFVLPPDAMASLGVLQHGTVISITSLRQQWDRDALKRLKSALAKLINPFGAAVDGFNISIVAPNELREDTKVSERARGRNEELSARDIINGHVGNFIFDALRDKTTFIEVRISDDSILTRLTDRGELVYSIREDNRYPLLSSSGVVCTLYYLNQSARLTFARRVGVPAVKFGSVFLFRNGFRVYPIGEETDDWFGFNRRKQQGYSRNLGGREVIGRVDVFSDDSLFDEASSRNQGLIDTPAVRQLRRFVVDQCLRRLERYVVPVSWPDKGEAKAEDISRLLTDPGRARVAAAVAALVDNDDIELLDFSRRLLSTLNERSTEFETSVANLRAIAEKGNDRTLLNQIAAAERHFEDLRRAEAEARRIADEERRVALAAMARAETAELAVGQTQELLDTEKRRSHFLESAVSVDISTVLNLHHQVTIYAVNAGQQIENFLQDTVGSDVVPRSAVLKVLEQLSYLNSKIYTVARFAVRARFQLNSEKIHTDISQFIADYIRDVASQFASARVRIEVDNTHTGLDMTFNPIDVSIIVDNLISNATKARASRISFEIRPEGKAGMLIQVTDNGRGLTPTTDRDRIFEMGYTTSGGSGLGLYHVRHMLGQLGGTIDVSEPSDGRGAAFTIRIVPGGKKDE